MKCLSLCIIKKSVKGALSLSYPLHDGRHTNKLANEDILCSCAKKTVFRYLEPEELKRPIVNNIIASHDIVSHYFFTWHGNSFAPSFLACMGA